MTMIELLLAFALAQDPNPIDVATRLYDEGTTLYEAADYDGAIKAFTESMNVAKELPEQQARPIRMQLLYNIALSHEKAYAIDKDPSHLRKALSLFQRYAAEIPNTGDSLDAEVNVARIEQKLRALDFIEVNKANPAEPSPPPPPAPDVEDEGEPDKKKRNIGIGLLTAGSAVTVGGIAVLVAGATLGPKAQRSVNDVTGGDMSHEAWEPGQVHIQDEQRRGRIFMGVGGGVAAVGVVGIVVGAIQVRKSRPAVAVTPSIGNAFTGLTISGRF